MTKICIFVGMTAGSYIGWFLGDRFGFWWAFFISGAGSMAGVYLGWKLARRIER